MKKLDENARRMIDAPNIGHLTTLMPGGHPKTEPVWIAREGDLVIVASDRKSIKVRNVAADGRVALSVVDADDPYEQLLVRGNVVELRPDEDLGALDAMSQKYRGEAFARRSWSSRVVMVIAADVVRYYVSPLSQRDRS